MNKGKGFGGLFIQAAWAIADFLDLNSAAFVILTNL
jgi:hypothetical protein